MRLTLTLVCCSSHKEPHPPIPTIKLNLVLYIAEICLIGSYGKAKSHLNNYIMYLSDFLYTVESNYNQNMEEINFYLHLSKFTETNQRWNFSAFHMQAAHDIVWPFPPPPQSQIHMYKTLIFFPSLEFFSYFWARNRGRITIRNRCIGSFNLRGKVSEIEFFRIKCIKYWIQVEHCEKKIKICCFINAQLNKCYTKITFKTLFKDKIWPKF